MRFGPPDKQFQRWRWSAALYLGIGLLDAGRTVFTMHAEGMHHSWSILFCTQLLGWLPWAVATPLIFRVADRFSLETARTAMFWLAHVSVALGIGVAQSLWATGLHAALHPYAPDENHNAFSRQWSYVLQGGLFGYAVVYAFVLAIRHALSAGERLAAKKMETARLNEPGDRSVGCTSTANGAAFSVQ